MSKQVLTRDTFNTDNPYITVGIGLYDHTNYLAPSFTPDWFGLAFLILFAYLCFFQSMLYILLGGLSRQFLFRIFLRMYKSFKAKKQNITFFAVFSHGTFATPTNAIVKTADDGSTDGDDNDNQKDDENHSGNREKIRRLETSQYDFHSSEPMLDDNPPPRSTMSLSIFLPQPLFLLMTYHHLLPLNILSFANLLKTFHLVIPHLWLEIPAQPLLIQQLPLIIIGIPHFVHLLIKVVSINQIELQFIQKPMDTQ